MSDLVKARWVGGYPVELPDGTKLAHGDEHKVPPGELASDHWEPVAAAKKPATTDQES